MEKALTTQQLIGNLLKVGHHTVDSKGKKKSITEALQIFIPDAMAVLKQDPDLFAHLIAWNSPKTEIRDTKVAFPVLALSGNPGPEHMYYDNAIAHLIQLDPMALMKAITFYQSIGPHSNRSTKMLRNAVIEYIRAREEKHHWWDSSVVQHRKNIKNLYKTFKIKPSLRADRILFKQDYPTNSVFEAIRTLKLQSPQEAAGLILKYKIPFLVAQGAVGGLGEKNIDLTLAIIESMSPADLITNSKMLEKLGVMSNNILRAAYDNGIAKMATNKRVSSLKATKAKEFVEDKKTKAKLEKAQEQRLDNLKGLEGNWLVLGDRSGSMQFSIEKAKEIAAFLARMGKGEISLVFFSEYPQEFDVTGKSLEEIKQLTRGVGAGGSTNISCGLELVANKGEIINGIVIVSDGGENRGSFVDTYRRYENKFGISPNVYLLHVSGDPDRLSYSCEDVIPYQKLEMKDVDAYGMPSLLNILRTSRYTLIDDIMSSQLLTVDDVVKQMRS
jgi:hypothetical protein